MARTGEGICRRCGWTIGPLVLALVASSSLGCIYDSRWGDAKTAQKNAAQHYSGAQLGAGNGAGQRLPARKQDVRKLRLVTLVTPEHATQVVNWQRRFSAPRCSAKRAGSSADGDFRGVLVS